MNQPDGKPQHTCDGCGLHMHSAAFCGYLTDDVKDKLDKTTLPSGFGTKVGGTVCKLCYKKYAVDASTATTANDVDGDPDDLPPLLSRDGGGLDGAGDASTATTDNDADRDPDDLPPLLSRDRGGLEGAGGKRPKGINDTGSTRKKRPRRIPKSPNLLSVTDKLAILDEIRLGMASQESICKQKGGVAEECC